VQMMMIHGFFHGDPHPGNVVVELGSGRLTFLDAGMVGQLDLRQRISFARFLLAFRDRDAAALAATLRSLSTPFREPDDREYRRRFEQRIGPLLEAAPDRSVPLQKLASEALDVLRGAGYRLDSQLTLAVKAIAQAEEITAALLPEAGASEFAQLGGAALEELVPEALASDTLVEGARRRAIRTAAEVVDSIPAAQAAAARWLDQFQKGELRVDVTLSNLDRSTARLESGGRLLAVAIVLTGMLIASAIAASIEPGGSGFRADVSDAALVLLLAVTALAILLLVPLLWRLARPHPRGAQRRRASS
jgi:ubiquinone biosynthesis protein